MGKGSVGLIGLLLLGPWSPAWAWGEAGHRIVGELAEARLTPAARAAVGELLAGEADPSLAGVSTWADEVRGKDPAWRWTAALHFINFQQGDCRYQPQQQCPEGKCIVAAITRFSHELVDRDAPAQRRLEALKFLVHFVGDLHQPLHAGLKSDRGGNDFQISYQRMGWNLHSVWDSLLIGSTKLDWPDYLAERIAPLPAPEAALLAETDPAAWALESCTIIHREDFYPPRHRINREYLERMRPEADQRLRLAGERLGALLNRLLAEG